MDFFQEQGAFCTLQYTNARGDGTKLAQQCADDGQELVIVLGGDGTFNEVASGLVRSDVALAIIPLGSGNGLARTLGMPGNIMHACRAIATGKTLSIDVGRLNKRYFFLLAGVGFDAVVGKKFDAVDKRGPLGYFYLSAREFFKYQPEEVEIDFAQHTQRARPFVVAIANGQQYGNNARIAPQARLDDGLFNLVIIHRLTLIDVFSQLPKLFTGRIETFPQAEFATTDSLIIKRPNAGFVNLDGEAVQDERELRFSILPRGLKIVAPQNATCFVE